jgi:CheY-like chemotaxis protein
MANAVTGDITVLVVEDDDLVRLMTATTIEDAGYSVCEAADGQEALAILEQHANKVRVVLSDIWMPRMNGDDLARVVSVRWPHLGIVLTSGYPPDGLAGLPKDVVFLSKPFRADELTEAVRRATDVTQPLRRTP